MADVIVSVGSVIILAKIQINYRKIQIDYREIEIAYWEKDSEFETRLKSAIDGHFNNRQEELSKISIFLGLFIGLFSSLFLLSIYITLVSRQRDTNLVDTNLVDTNLVNGFNLNPCPKRKEDLDAFIGFDVSSYHDVI
jgi:hypothetical protein